MSVSQVRGSACLIIALACAPMATAQLQQQGAGRRCVASLLHGQRGLGFLRTTIQFEGDTR